MSSITSKNTEDQSPLTSQGNAAVPTAIPAGLREVEEPNQDWANELEADLAADLETANNSPSEPAVPADSNVHNLDKSAIVAGSSDLEESAGLPNPTEDWPDEELLHCFGAAVEDGDEAELEGLAILRRSVRLRWRGCKAASIFRKRHKKTRDWGKLLKKSSLPRSTLTEMADIFDRATKQGHGEEDVAKHRIWTDVKIAYLKPKKTDASDDGQKDGAQGPVESESVGQPEGTTSGTGTTGTDAGSATTKPEGSEQPQLKVVCEDDGPDGQADAGEAEPQEGQQTDTESSTVARPEEEKAQPPVSRKTGKRQPAEVAASPTEIGYATAFVGKMGGWKKTAEVVESVTELVAGVDPHSWERAVLAINEAKKLIAGAT